MNRILFDINIKKIMQIILCILSLVTVEGCIYPAVFTARTCDGRIVDADTKLPIEGVVVLGIWYNEYGTAGGAVNRYHDAKETVTEKNGVFVIKGNDFMIFKAGYEYLRLDTAIFQKHVEDIGLRDKIKWEGGKAIIPLRKLTMEERKRRIILGSPPMESPFEKVKYYLRELDKERVQIGLKPRGIWGGVSYE